MKGVKQLWYALFRNDGNETDVGEAQKNMVVAWMHKTKMEKEVKIYIDWDKEASGATKWHVISFQRDDREDYFKKQTEEDKKEKVEKCLEYHWVWDDYINFAKPDIKKCILKSYP